MISLHLRMTLLLAALFGLVYAIVVMAGTFMGIQNFYLYLVIAFGFMFIQYLIGPKMVEWTMRIRYIKREEAPELYSMIETQAQQAGIPMPRVAISQVALPNAFAFGRGRRDGRVCVTEGIMKLLNKEELRAVIGHELAHIKNRDVLTITLLSVIPMIMYRLAWHFMFMGGHNNRDRGSNTVIIGIIAFIFYFVTNLLVLYASRVREYFADKGSVELGNRPEALASALYKLVYGSARLGKNGIKEVEGLKAFFMNDPSNAYNEIKELSQLDINKSGTIDSSELAMIKTQTLKLGWGERMMEFLSTHPNMLKRVQHLSSLS